MQGDVLLFQSLDGGEIKVENNQIVLTAGLESAVYLSLFSPADWFLNDVADTNEEKLSSETEQIVGRLPNVSKNYPLLEQAIKNDLSWLTSQKLAKSISASVSSNQINRVNIVINIDGVELTFTEGWSTNGN
jgi:phage gp46-like protein